MVVNPARGSHAEGPQQHGKARAGPGLSAALQSGLELWTVVDLATLDLAELRNYPARGGRSGSRRLPSSGRRVLSRWRLAFSRQLLARIQESGADHLPHKP